MHFCKNMFLLAGACSCACSHLGLCLQTFIVVVTHLDLELQCLGSILGSKFFPSLSVSGKGLSAAPCDVQCIQILNKRSPPRDSGASLLMFGARWFPFGCGLGVRWFSIRRM